VDKAEQLGLVHRAPHERARLGQAKITRVGAHRTQAPTML